MMTKKQRIIAGLVAGCSTLLIIVSAFFLAGPGAGAFPSDLLQTTAPSASQAGQHEGGSADQRASSSDATADATAGSTAPAAQAPTEGGNAAAPAAGGAGGQAANGGGGASTTPPASDPGVPPQQPAAPATITVTVNVSSDAVGGGVHASVHPTFNQGATAYDALCATGLSVNAANSQYGIYVSAIGGLAEKDHGASSGWLYAINGSTPGTSCSASVLHDGDTVEWRYVL